jgi:hypothetical protein
MPAPIFIAYLRRPRKRSDETRADPYYEIGSYGITTCKCRNLMHPKHAYKKKDSRIAFIQPGKEQVKLVFLTPPIDQVKIFEIINPKPNGCKGCTEVIWDSTFGPFKFIDAPIICDNKGNTDFPELIRYVEGADCSSLRLKLMSKFRSRSRKLETNLVEEIITVYDQHVRDSNKQSYAEQYWETLPYPPPSKDTERQQTYNNYLSRRKLIGTI